MRVSEEQVEWLADQLQQLLPICDLEKDWYYIKSIEYMPDDRYFISMKSEVNPKMYKEIVCDLQHNGDSNPLVITDAEFSPHGSPCISENIYTY